MPTDLMQKRRPFLTRGSVTPERVELAAEVRRLRDDEGLLFREIRDRIGISYSYAQALYTDPDGSKALARKDRYRGTCVDCGNPTCGANGRDAAPERCEPCARALAHAERKWTRESVIDAIQRFALANGRPPLADEWIAADAVKGYPPRSSVYQSSNGSTNPFASWADAIEAAGYTRPRVGQYVRRPRATRKPKRYAHTPEGSRIMRDYIVLEHDGNNWVEHGPVQSHSEALAIETLVETLGNQNGLATHKFVAVSSARWIVRELRPVTSFKAVAAETT